MNPTLQNLSNHTNSNPSVGCANFRMPWLVATLALLFGACGSIYATNLTWDPGNTNDGAIIETGSGNWDTGATNLNWNNGTGNTNWTQTSATGPLNGAIFGGPDAPSGTYQITLDGGQMAYTNLLIAANGYVFTDASRLGGTAGSVFLGTAGTLTVNDGKSVIFNCNLESPAQNAAKFFQLNAAVTPATMVVNGNIGADQVVFNGTNGATFWLGGNTLCSVTTIDAIVHQTNGTSSTSATWQVGRSVTGSLGNNTGTYFLDGASTTFNWNTGIQISRGGGNGTVIFQNNCIGNITGANNIQIESELANNSHGAVFVHSGATVTVGNSGTAGKILLNVSGSNPGSTAVFSQDGGTVYAWGGISIGNTTGTYTGGTAAVTNSGGFLYIGDVGATGISYGTAGHAPTNYVVLSGGTVGALQSWISPVPMILDVPNGNITFQCADNGGSPYNIGLSGALTGPGGFNLTGGGTLTLSGSNNIAGSTVISNGTLVVKTLASPTNGPVTVDASTYNPTLSVVLGATAQYWSMGNLTFQFGSPTADFNYGISGPSTTVAPIIINGNLALNSIPNFQVDGSAIPVGTFPLIQYTGTLSGTALSSTSVVYYRSRGFGICHEPAIQQDDCAGGDHFLGYAGHLLGDDQWDLGFHVIQLAVEHAARLGEVCGWGPGYFG